MSDEQTPPPPALRLKPRLRPDAPAAGAEGAPSASAPEAAPPPAGAAPATPGKIRFKPRLTGEVAPPAPAPDEQAVPATPPPPPVPEPAAIIPVIIPAPEPPPSAAVPAPAAVAPPAEAAPGAPRVKLKARISSPPPAIPAAPAPVAPPPAVIPAVIPVSPPPAIVPEPAAAFTPPAPPPEAPPADTAEPAKFKLKPKSGAAPAMIGGIPIAAPQPPPAPAPAADGAKAPPPFPVVAPAGKGGKTTPPIPHVVVKAEVTEPEAPVRLPLGGKAKAKRGKRLAILGVVGVLVLGAAGFFLYKIYLGEEPPPPPPVTKKVAPKAAPATAATPPADANKAAASGPATSETRTPTTVPGQIVNNAKTTINNAAQGRQAALEDVAAGDPSNQPKASTPATNTATAVRGVAPGISATTEVQAASEASVAFRAYVANVKIGGVVVTRAIINNKLTRAGETVDNALGITFEGYDPDTKLLTFRDRSGAVVSRKYP